MPFLDDIGVKGLYTDYNGEEVLLGIRRYIFEYIQNLDKTLKRIKRVGGSIRAKSQFYRNGLNVVRFVYNLGGREPSTDKVIKILNQKEPENTTEAKGFLGLYVYFRIQVKDFGQITEPIYYLFKKGIKWHQDLELQGKAIKTLQNTMTIAPVLIRINYRPKAREIVVRVDASLEGYRGYLGQRDPKTQRVRPARYKSRVWSKAEKKYDATKREYCRVLKIFKKLRVWITRVYFMLETNANMLVAQLNRAATDYPRALITRWLTQIRLFDFEVRHVPRKQHTVADALSQRPRHPDDTDLSDKDVNNWILTELGVYEICPMIASNNNDSEELGEEDPELQSRRLILQDMKDRIVRLQEQGEIDSRDSDNSSKGYDDLDYKTPISKAKDSEDFIRIANYLTTLKKLKDMSLLEFQKFKREVLNYRVYRRKLQWLLTKGMPIKLVINDKRTRAQILHDVHDRNRHRGRESTYYRVLQQYFWHGYYKDVMDYVKTCEECQFRTVRREEEAIYPIASNRLIEK